MALPVNIDDLFNGLETSQKIAQEKQRPLNADNLPKFWKGVSITAEEELCLVADRLKDAWKISQEISQKNLSAKSLTRWSRIVQAILRDGSVTALRLAQQLHATYRTIQSDMRILKTLEVIRRDGPDKGGKWIVTLKIYGTTAWVIIFVVGKC